MRCRNCALMIVYCIMKTVLAPIDLSEAAASVISQAGALAGDVGGRVLLLHVVPPPAVINEYAPEAERLAEEEKKKAVAEFNFKKGIIVAIFSGLTSSGMSFGLQGGPGLQKLALTTAPATSIIWAGMPVLVVVLFGGFLVNAAYCVILNIKNKTGGDYVKRTAPILPNIFFAGLAGAIWCCQFICFKTGEPQMGATSYIGWAVLMASAIFFSQILGVILGEWKGTSKKTIGLLVVGLVLLMASAAVAAYSGSLKA